MCVFRSYVLSQPFQSIRQQETTWNHIFRRWRPSNCATQCFGHIVARLGTVATIVGAAALSIGKKRLVAEAGCDGQEAEETTRRSVWGRQWKNNACEAHPHMQEQRSLTGLGVVSENKQESFQEADEQRRFGESCSCTGERPRTLPKTGEQRGQMGLRVVAVLVAGGSGSFSITRQNCQDREIHGRSKEEELLGRWRCRFMVT